MKRELQNPLILTHLRNKQTRSRGLSQMEALGLYQVWRLASRIEELREDHVIRTEMRVDRLGRRYARYFYVKPKGNK